MPMTTPDWTVAEWLNSDGPLTLSDFQGRIVVLEAFQMLCPGCVAHGLPLLQQVQATPTLVLFDREGRRVRQYFGQISALALGANIGALLVSSDESSG